ncbi:ribbon-helix-helix domain-containing protein [Halorubrum aethiopicum]|uniref:ribbon-helix-helix domain-containing protein n=1 Tax=Halorubrum aethiopicum TaxID=1758255 RepID=UPI000AE0114C|nr:ribbon-helix-helix domain-containing protein [Halorubrum aethiopicum]
MATGERKPVFPDDVDALRHRITARVSRDHLNELDERVEAGEFRNRSHAIRLAIADLLDEMEDETEHSATDHTDDADDTGTTPDDD